MSTFARMAPAAYLPDRMLTTSKSFALPIMEDCAPAHGPFSQCAVWASSNNSAIYGQGNPAGYFDGDIYAYSPCQAKENTAGDPEGTLYFSFQFTGKVDPVTLAEIHGRCQHRIIAGTGGFAGASGVLTFKDDVTNGTSLYRGPVTP